MPETCTTCGADDIPDGTLAEHELIHVPLTGDPEPTPHVNLPYPEKLAAYLEAWAGEMTSHTAAQGARWAADVVRRSQADPTLIDSLPPDRPEVDVNRLLDLLDAQEAS